MKTFYTSGLADFLDKPLKRFLLLTGLPQKQFSSCLSDFVAQRIFGLSTALISFAAKTLRYRGSRITIEALSLTIQKSISPTISADFIAHKFYTAGLKKLLTGLFILVTLFSPNYPAQSVRDKLFEEVTALLNMAQSQSADFLCPSKFEKAVGHYITAKKYVEKGKSSQDIRIELEWAISYLTKLNDEIEERSKVFDKVLDARKEALNAGADKYAVKFWSSAEERFKDAVDDYSDQDYNDVRKAVPAILDDFQKAKTYSDYARNLVFTWKPLRNADSWLANLLSPSNYSKGLSILVDILESISHGDDMRSIKESVISAGAFFNSAAENSKRFANRYPELMRKRKDAAAAGAETYSSDLWHDAEETLLDAALSFEENKIERAVESTFEAEQKYLAAKHLAVRTDLLSKADELILIAEEEEADDYAGKSFYEAKYLIQSAMNIIYSDNYYYSNLKIIAGQSEAKANQAREITSIIKSVDEGENTWEDLILDWRESLKKESSIERIGATVPAGKTTPELSQRSKNIPPEVYDLFGPGEAEITDAGGEVLIRLIGLKFTWLGYTLNNDMEMILDKVILALKFFSFSTITVAGHNDYVAARTFNQEISQKRADNIRDYILAHSTIDPSRIYAIGHGETQPITNDKSYEGREKNRRIELIIK
jgi:outer membrane protein OmpA-like peptidoglycan-associated protein